MNWTDLFIIGGGIICAGFFFGLAAWLHFTPPKPDGCWLKRPGFNGKNVNKKPRTLKNKGKMRIKPTLTR